MLPTSKKGEGPDMKRVWMAAVAALMFAPLMASAATVQLERVAAEVSLSVTSSFQPNYWSAYRDISDEACYTQDGGDRGCVTGRDLGFDATQDGLRLRSSVWSQFIAPTAPGWGGVSMGNYSDLSGYLSWYNDTETNQTVSWRVDYDLSQDVSSLRNLSGHSRASFRLYGESYGGVQVDGCVPFSRQGPAAGFFSCSRMLAPGQDLDLFLTTSAVTYLTLNEMDVTVVPLPAALPFLAASLAGLGFVGRRKKKAA